jgi:hypothetical protein
MSILTAIIEFWLALRRERPESVTDFLKAVVTDFFEADALSYWWSQRSKK